MNPFPALGIIAGSGELPRVIIQSCIDTGRPLLVLALEETADEATVDLAQAHHAWIRFGAIGKALDLARKHHVGELVMAGHVTRPRISTLRPDLKGAKLLARIGTQLISGGDNSLLSSIVSFLEEEGFRASRTHFDSGGVRTDATKEETVGVVRKRAKRSAEAG
jgi:DUF1009 family protein